MKRLIQILTIICVLFLIAGCLKLDKPEQPKEKSSEEIELTEKVRRTNEMNQLQKGKEREILLRRRYS